MAEPRTLAKNMNLAKLVQPDVSGLIERERLFKLLDRSRDGFCWVMGPAGSGKTSLLTSWAASRQKHTLWYRVDLADADPATFFHYFSLALGEYAAHLPAFSVEHIPNLEIFARRYFRACFQAIPTNTVIIFDNCHTVNPDDSFFLLLHWLLEERIPGVSVVCTSRQVMPARLHPWQVMPNFGFIGWELLFSTLDEADAVAKLLGFPEVPRQIYDCTGGWLAGLVLQLKVKQGAALNPLPHHDADEMAVLFSVFAESAFNSLNSEQQQLLLSTAFAPRLTHTLAAELSANGKAHEILFQLHRSHFFLERSSLADGSLSYSFHPLLKAFLKDQAKKRLSETSLNKQLDLIADWLE